MNYVIDLELREHNIIYPKYILIFFVVVNFILLVLSLFIKIIFVFSGMCFFIVLIFSTLYFSNLRKYGLRIKLDNNQIQAIDSKGKILKTFEKNNIFIEKINVLFDWVAPKLIKKECLLISNKKESFVSNEIEYRSYWKNPNFVIIQNPELILYLEQELGRTGRTGDGSVSGMLTLA